MICILSICINKAFILLCSTIYFIRTLNTWNKGLDETVTTCRYMVFEENVAKEACDEAEKKLEELLQDFQRTVQMPVPWTNLDSFLETECHNVVMFFQRSTVQP